MQAKYEAFKAFCESITAPVNIPWWTVPLGLAVVIAIIF